MIRKDLNQFYIYSLKFFFCVVREMENHCLKQVSKIAFVFRFSFSLHVEAKRNKKHQLFMLFIKLE